MKLILRIIGVKFVLIISFILPFYSCEEPEEEQIGIGDGEFIFNSGLTHIKTSYYTNKNSTLYFLTSDFVEQNIGGIRAKNPSEFTDYMSIRVYEGTNVSIREGTRENIFGYFYSRALSGFLNAFETKDSVFFDSLRFERNDSQFQVNGYRNDSLILKYNGQIYQFSVDE